MTRPAREHSTVSNKRSTILFLASDPSNASRLRLGQELREIQNCLQLAASRVRFQLVERMSVRPRDLSQAILDARPSIVHFSGHGTASGELCLEDDLGHIHPVSARALADLFSLFAEQVQCVMLNACFSEKQARAIAEHISYVVGITQSIDDAAAIAFAGGFYKGVAAGRSIPDAFRLGVVELQLLNISDGAMPVLIRGSREPAHLLLDERDYVFPTGPNSVIVRFEECHHHYAKIEVVLPNTPRGCILVDPLRYNSMRHMLDDLFLEYLSKAVPPHTYGEEWMIVTRAGVVAVPWQWVRQPGTRVSELDPEWYDTAPEAMGLSPGERAKIVAPRGVKTVAVASNNPKMFSLVFSSPKVIAMIEGTYLKERIFDNFSPSEYRYKWVSEARFCEPRRLLVDTGKDLSEAIDRWVRHKVGRDTHLEGHRLRSQPACRPLSLRRRRTAAPGQ